MLVRSHRPVFCSRLSRSCGHRYGSGGHTSIVIGRSTFAPACDLAACPSEGEVLELPRPRAAGDDAGAVLHPDLEARAVVGLHRTDMIEVDDVAAMDPHEPLG